MPVMIPAAGISAPYIPHAASCENSRNGDPTSSSCRSARGEEFSPLRMLGTGFFFPPLFDLQHLFAEIGYQGGHQFGIGAEFIRLGRTLLFSMVIVG